MPEKPKITPQARRLREFAIEYFGSTSSLAKKLSISLQGLTPYLSGRQAIGPKMSQKLAALGADVDYIKTGRMPETKADSCHAKSYQPHAEMLYHDKFIKLVWYVLFRYGAKLNKEKLGMVIYFADRNMKVKFGKTLAGETYLKTKDGIDAQHLGQALVWLENFGYLVQGNAALSVPVCPPLGEFTAEEISVVEQTLSFVLAQAPKKLIGMVQDEVWKQVPENKVVRF